MNALEILKKHYDYDEGFTQYETDCIVKAMEEYAMEQALNFAAFKEQYQMPKPLYAIWEFYLDNCEQSEKCCKHIWIRTTKNYKPAWKCFECNKLVTENPKKRKP